MGLISFGVISSASLDGLQGFRKPIGTFNAGAKTGRNSIIKECSTQYYKREGNSAEIKNT
jgi:hypothetical protein